MSEILKPYKAQIDTDKHLQHLWKTHALLSDFRIEDMWQLPVTLKESDSVAFSSLGEPFN